MNLGCLTQFHMDIKSYLNNNVKCDNCALQVITQRVVVIPYRHFGTTYRSPLKLGLIGCLETPVINYHYSLRNSPEERSSYLLRGGSLNSRMSSAIILLILSMTTMHTFRMCLKIKNSLTIQLQKLCRFIIYYLTNTGS